jgi:RimJ/RimL family protein N-acetyltransferase
MIRGKQVELRPVEDDDAALILRWQNHPDVWWSMDYERPFSLRDVREDIERSRREGHPFVVTVEGRPVGRIGLNRFRPRDRRCSLYVYIGEPEVWGRAFDRDAVMTMLGYAFDRLDLHLVHLRTLAANEALIEMYERCGFARESQLRDRSWRDGRWLDHVEMSVTGEEFAKVRETWDAETIDAA